MSNFVRTGEQEARRAGCCKVRTSDTSRPVAGCQFASGALPTRQVLVVACKLPLLWFFSTLARASARMAVLPGGKIRRVPSHRQSDPRGVARVHSQDVRTGSNGGHRATATPGDGRSSFAGLF